MARQSRLNRKRQKERRLALEHRDAPTRGPCGHHWQIDSLADGDVFHATCQKCGETRDFPTWPESMEAATMIYKERGGTGALSVFD